MRIQDAFGEDLTTGDVVIFNNTYYKVLAVGSDPEVDDYVVVRPLVNVLNIPSNRVERYFGEVDEDIKI